MDKLSYYRIGFAADDNDFIITLAGKAYAFDYKKEAGEAIKDIKAGKRDHNIAHYDFKVVLVMNDFGR